MKIAKEVEINFGINKELYNYKYSVKEIKFKNNEVKIFNFVIGIIGANASGKSVILELISKYQQFNESDLTFNKEIINPFGLKYRIQQKIFDSSDFNASSNFIKIIVLFQTDFGDYTYEVIVKNSNIFEETVLKDKESIWQQDNGTSSKLTFLRF